mgnify:FL=1
MATNSNKGTIMYRKVARTPQTGENKGKTLYYATAVTNREVSFEEFISHIASHNTPYSRGTIKGLTTDVLDCLQELILDGKSVRLGDLGLFSIGISSRGETTAAKVTADSVQDVHLILRNTKSWSNKALRELVNLRAYNSYGTDADAGPTAPGDSGSKGDGGGTTQPGDSGSKGDGGGTTQPGGEDSGNVGL